MALENKKSLLQPESVEAQQYRLQNSRLAARVEQTISTGNQQSSAGAARPAGRPSVLAPSTPPSPLPAESNATVSSTVPGGSPTPIPSPAPPSGHPDNSPSVPTPPVVYKRDAISLDGSAYLTASLDLTDPDLSIANVTGSRWGFVFMVDMENRKAGHRQTLLHTYSGSAQSSSLEMGIGGDGHPFLEYKNNGGVVTYAGHPNTQVRTRHLNRLDQLEGKQGNGYTYIQFDRKTSGDNTPNVRADHNGMLGAGGAIFESSSVSASSILGADLDISNNDNFYIGGTSARPNSNFSGSIAYAAIYKRAPFAGFIQQLRGKGTDPTYSTANNNFVREYRFNGNILELTGSLATTQVPLGISGSVTYVDAHK